MPRRDRPRDRQRRERQRGRRAAVAGRVVVVVTRMVMRRVVMCRVVMRARRTMHMPVAVRVAGMVAVAAIVPRVVRGSVIVVMVVTAPMRLRTACGPVAVRVLAGRRHRVGNGRRLRVARIGAARIGAAGMTVSWVVGTLGIGHDNLLNGFQWLDGVELTP